MKLIGIATVLIVMSANCGPATQQKIVNTIPTATSCVLDIIDAATAGSIDIAAIIKDCGTTAEDIIAIVSGELQQQDAGVVADAGVGVKHHDSAKLLETYRKAYAYKGAK